MMFLIAQFPAKFEFSVKLRAVSSRANFQASKLRSDSSRTGLISATSTSNQSDDETKLDMKINDIMARAVSQGLSHFGGSDVVESLLYILELEHSVNIRNLGGEIVKLRTALGAMFGTASYVVEEHICANLAKTLGLDPDGRSLEELVKEARRVSISKPS